MIKFVVEHKWVFLAAAAGAAVYCYHRKISLKEVAKDLVKDVTGVEVGK